jgi:hypothetical protein
MRRSHFSDELAGPAAVFLHTNRDVRARPPTYRELEVVTGWTADRLGPKWQAGVQRKFGKHIMRERQIHQTAKYQWLIEAGRNASTAPWVMIDTDTVVQCDGAEMARRFASFGADLVVSGELEWWPKWQSHKLDPWWGREGGPFPYPNAGAVAGSRVGWTRLVEQMLRMPRFPCCPGYHRGATVETKPASCIVGDQHCLQAAMQAPCSMADANRSESCGEHVFEYRVDTSAQLFLSMSMVKPADVVRGRDGRFKYAPTGSTPCVLHFNGHSKSELIKYTLLSNNASHTYDAWAVPGAEKYGCTERSEHR